MRRSDRVAARPAWNYDRSELVADGVVHGIGIVLGVAGAIALLIMAGHMSGGTRVASVLIYGFGLLTMLGISAAYNLWPVSPVKWLLRRFDHSAIYVLIAATYTPFLAQVKASFVTTGVLILVWSVAAVGVALKLLLPGRLDRFSIVLYLLLGWCGVVAYDAVLAPLPGPTLWLLAAGGLLYSAGLVFHLWENLRFQNAIWHGFVLLAAACHYIAVLQYSTLT